MSLSGIPPFISASKEWEGSSRGIGLDSSRFDATITLSHPNGSEPVRAVIRTAYIEGRTEDEVVRQYPVYGVVVTNQDHLQSLLADNRAVTTCRTSAEAVETAKTLNQNSAEQYHRDRMAGLLTSIATWATTDQYKGSIVVPAAINTAPKITPSL